jgi:GTP-binding protein
MAMAVVALVGRPNTGKSTLFNRLVGRRIAITLHEPGITRDRIIRTAEWSGKRCQVIDTGGLVPDADDEIQRQIERQVRVALAEADVVVLVVDGRDGCHPLDQEIAARLRREGTRFLVAVNKLDARREFDEAEFHALGGDRLFPISAEHGIGVDDLLEEVFDRFGKVPRAPGRESLPLAILGRPNVGKSSFLNALLGSERSIVTAIPGTTRDVIEQDFELDGRAFRLIDTAGIRRRTRVTDGVEFYSVTRALDTIDRCAVALLVVDATEGPTSQDQRLARLIDSRARGLVVVANKMDLVPRNLVDDVERWVDRHLAFVGYAPVAWTSALNGTGVADAVREAGRVHDAGGRQLSNALLRESVLPRLQRRQPAYNCRVLAISQTGTRPPVFRLRLSNPAAADKTWLRFVVTEIRRAFGFAGYPVRVRTNR